jgi:hypothetical protein
MSVWLEIHRRRPDGRHKASRRTTVWSAFQISQKFFPEMSCVQTVLPCRPDGRTLAARNFYIKALHVRTIEYVVWTVDLMHAISIYVARASEPLRLASGRFDFECTTCLMDERVQTGIHIVRTVIAVFSYLCFGKKSITDRTLSGVRTCCWNVWTDASWSSSKLLNTEEGPDGKFSSSRRMMLGQLSIRTVYHVVPTAANDPISLTCRLCRIF